MVSVERFAALGGGGHQNQYIIQHILGVKYILCIFVPYAHQYSTNNISFRGVQASTDSFHWEDTQHMPYAYKYAGSLSHLDVNLVPHNTHHCWETRYSMFVMNPIPCVKHVLYVCYRTHEQAKKPYVSCIFHL